MTYQRTALSYQGMERDGTCPRGGLTDAAKYGDIGGQ
jgi:hypothetical protein